MSLPETVNLLAAYNEISAHWSPKILAQVNDQYVKIAKIENEFVWHKHDDSDELFFIVKGELKMQYEDKNVLLKEGDIHVVPKGVMHNPYAENECYVLFIETTDTSHTGDIVTSRTKSIEAQLS